MAIDGIGGVVVAWQDNRDGNYEIYWRRFSRFGAALTNEVRVTSTADKSARPDIACANGNTCIVWQEGEGVNGTGTVYFASLDSGGNTIVSPRSLKTLSGSARISTRTNGDADIVFHHFSIADQDVYFQRLNSAGTLLCERRYNAGSIPALAKTPVVASLAGTSALYWVDMNGVWQIGLLAGTANLSCQSASSMLIADFDMLNPSTDADPSTSVAWVIFERLGTIRNSQGGGSSCVIGGSGQAHRPGVATDGLNGFAAWQDSRHGNNEIYMSRFSGCTSETGDVRLTNDAAVSENPDIAAPRDGSGEWFVVWQDNRDGNWEIYWEANVQPAMLRLTGKVRQERAGDPFISPSPPIGGATVVLKVGGVTYSRTTDADGLATFPESPTAGGEYTVSLDGPDYRVSCQTRFGGEFIPEATVAMNPASPSTEFEWPSSPAMIDAPSIQAAYSFNRFRTDFWQGRLGYQWTLRQMRDPSEPFNYLKLILHEDQWNCGRGSPACTGESFTAVQCQMSRVAEADVLFHEYAHDVVADRFMAVAGRGRTFTHPHSSVKESQTNQGGAIDEALADYFAATFTADPVIDECHDRIGILCLRLRNLNNNRRMPSEGYRFESHDGSEILSGALWDLRQLIDGNVDEAVVTDQLLFRAIDRVISANPDSLQQYTFAMYYDAVKAVDQTVWGGQYSAQIDQAFARHNIPTTQVHSPLYWQLDEAFTDAARDFTSIRIRWRELPGAVSYQVLRARAADGDGTGIGSFAVVDSAVADTTYVMLDHALLENYLIAVVPVDAAGERGYTSNAVFIPRYRRGTHLKPQQTGSGPSLAASGRWLFNTPNPFNPVTQLQFELTAPDHVEISIFDVAGRRVVSLAARSFSAGVNSIEWDGRDSAGQRVASGVYWVLLEGTRWQSVGKVTVVR